MIRTALPPKPMREINLQEYQRSYCPYFISGGERSLLLEVARVTVEPDSGTDAGGGYFLIPSSIVGAIAAGDLSVVIRPKIGIPQALSLACYAIGKIRFRLDDFPFLAAYSLPDVLALALAHQARRAFGRGLLHGYRDREEALFTVRGRIWFDNQLQRRFGIPLPVEVRYDEFTADILANRLVKAAGYRLGGMPLRSSESRRNMGWMAAMLEDVSLDEFAPDRVPSLRFDRLNEHYRGVVELARLVLRYSAYELGRGAVRASGFLMDMNVVFQEFVAQALRESLGLSEQAFRSDKEIAGVTLDESGQVGLAPDLSWWESGACVFAGDAKYKNLSGKSSVPNADLYQMLAYAAALGLPGGLLIYAAGEAEATSYRVRRSGQRLVVAALDLSGNLDDVLAGVDALAQTVIALRDATVLWPVTAERRVGSGRPKQVAEAFRKEARSTAARP